MYTVIDGLEIDPALEGETHINIYSNSNCSLGRLLSNFQYMPSDTPHGRFNSMEGYYHWLKLKLAIDAYDGVLEGWVERLEQLRYVHGITAQRIGRTLRNELIANKVRINDIPTEEFNRLFKYALLTKIMSHRELYLEMMDNRLPFVHYYMMDGKIIYKPRFSWLSNLITEIHVQMLGL